MCVCVCVEERGRWNVESGEAHRLPWRCVPSGAHRSARCRPAAATTGGSRLVSRAQEAGGDVAARARRGPAVLVVEGARTGGPYNGSLASTLARCMWRGAAWWPRTAVCSVETVCGSVDCVRRRLCAADCVRRSVDARPSSRCLRLSVRRPVFEARVAAAVI